MRRLLILIKAIMKLPLRLFSKISLLALVVDCNVDSKSSIGSFTRIYRSNMKRYSYIGRSSFITNTNIGSFCCIANDVKIGGTSHPLDWVSTSSVFHKWENVIKKNFSRHEFDIFHTTTIGNDVWIGDNVMIKAGINIADGAVIGMGAVVTKNVGPYEVWAGNPAKMIKKRFDDETIRRLLKTEWWSWNDDEIERYAQYFNNTNIFLNKWENKNK